MNALLKFIRSRFPTKVLHPGTYVVNIRIEHPQISGGAIAKTRIAIDANSKAHARARLKEELRIIVGTARKV